MYDLSHSFWNSIYRKNKKRKESASELVLDFHFRCQARPIPKNLWKDFYDSTSGAYIHGRISTFLLESQNSYCSYCREKIYHKINSNIEHILSRLSYPQFTFTLKNFSAICITCNAIKGAKDYHQLDQKVLDYDAHEVALTCYHPNYHKFDEHINMLCIQTNRIYVRTYVGRTDPGKEFCKAHLVALTTYSYKKSANPAGAAVIEKLATIIAGSDKPNDAIRKMLASLIEKV